MKVIISPAKQMKVDTDTFVCEELPVFTDKAEILKNIIREMSYEEKKKLWNCSDKIARQNEERFETMDLKRVSHRLCLHTTVSSTLIWHHLFLRTDSLTMFRSIFVYYPDSTGS